MVFVSYISLATSGNRICNPMKQFPLALQMWSVRTQAAQNLDSVLASLASYGYTGVELTAHHYQLSPTELRDRLDAHGLKAAGTHGPCVDKTHLQQSVETAQALGYNRIGFNFREPDLETADKIKASMDRFAEAAELLKPYGIKVMFHNHWWEYDRLVNGLLPAEMLLCASSQVYAQVDTYWVAVAGQAPSDILKRFGNRVLSVHLKDGPMEKGKQQTALGDGKMDMPHVLSSLPDSVEWVVVELDGCNTDMMEAVRKSAEFLISKNIIRKG